MSRKARYEESRAPVIRNEILQVADMVAKDKGIGKEEILGAMEQAILKTAQTKYGEEHDILVEIDRLTGEIRSKRNLTVVEEIVDPNKEISLEEALKKDKTATIGGVISELLPPVDFGRVSAQTARGIITKKIREAERRKQLEDFSGRIGEIIVGVVKRLDYSDIILDIGRTDGILKRNDTIKNESFKVGDRIKVLIVKLNDADVNEPILHLSRTHNDFMKRLFEQEVPEIGDGIVQVMAVARDPGSKAKIAITTSDTRIDAVGTCVGIKGARVQAVTEELKGEKIDIIQWSDNIAVFIVNALVHADVARLVLDEEKKTAEAVIPKDQLSATIGRSGQNIRLASKLTGWTITVVSEEEDAKRRVEENVKTLQHLRSNLDIDEMVAHLLIAEGLTNVGDIAETDIAELQSIEGFDENLATEIKKRAIDALAKKKKSLDNRCKRKGVKKDLRDYAVISTDLLEVFVNAGLRSLNDLADLSTDELLDITGTMITRTEAEALIMDARKDWFKDNDQ
ncbi:MAG: transcription termination factor NusA [Holosporales bacterium]|jgi:N utilization substance protein A|nr:transcription termination factor NusA [Holosporales bacterium]